MYVVTGLYQTAIKGCKVQSLRSAKVDRRGIIHDHKFLIVDKNGMFVAQRSANGLGVARPQLYNVDAVVEGGILCIGIPGMGTYYIPVGKCDGELVECQVWKNYRGPAHDQGAGISRVLSDYLDGKFRLVRMPDSHTRLSKTGKSAMGYQDRFPFNLLSEDSREDLGRRDGTIYTTERFRPTITIARMDGERDPYIEDRAGSFEISGISFGDGELCERCLLINTDPETGKYDRVGPLKTLSGYRKVAGKVVLGRHLDHFGTGQITLKDYVEIK